jgi:hypothetical protein
VPDVLGLILDLGVQRVRLTWYGTKQTLPDYIRYNTINYEDAVWDIGINLIPQPGKWFRTVWFISTSLFLWN